MRVPLQRQLNTRPSSEPLRGPEYAPGADAFGAQVGQSLQGLAANTLAFGQMVRQQEEEKRRFAALRSLTEFQVQQRTAFEESKRANVPGSTNFYESVQTTYTDSERKFLASLPPELQDEFRVRTTEFGGNLGLDAVKYQYETNDTYFKQSLQDSFDNARLQLNQDDAPEALETQRQMLHEQIAAAGISEAEKIALQRKADSGLEAVAYKKAQLKRLMDQQSGEVTALTGATDLLDVSGLTELQAQEAALRGREIVLGSFGAQSADTWQALPQRIQSLLISAAAKKNELPGSIVAAVANGDMEELADALRKEGLETEADLVVNPSSAIDNDPAFSNLSFEDRIAITADAERDAAAMLSDQVAASKAQQADYVNQMKVALYDGQAGQADIDTLRELMPDMKYEDIKSMQDILEKRDEDLRFRQQGAAFLDGSATYAPGDEDHKKILNALVGDKGLEAIDAMDSNYTSQSLIPLVATTGAVPDDVKNLVSGMIRSQDPQKAYWAMDLMSQLERNAPKGYTQFAAADRQDVDLWQARKDYMKQDELLALIRGPSDPAARNSRIAAREEGYKLFTDPNGPMRNFDPTSLVVNAAENIAGQVDGGFFGIGRATLPSTKWAADQLESDFQALFVDHYSRSGDVELAKETAFKELTRVWSVTNTGADKKLMKWAPEKVYPPVGESYDWMEQQIRDEGLVLPDQQFELLTDSQTEQEVGSGVPPSYVLIKHKDGVMSAELVPTEVNGRVEMLPQRVYFDYGAEQQADQQRWREQQKAAFEQKDLDRIIGDGFQKTLDEGVTMPDAVYEEYLQQKALEPMWSNDQTGVQ